MRWREGRRGRWIASGMLVQALAHTCGQSANLGRGLMQVGDHDDREATEVRALFEAGEL